jgi:hypothetical protein
VGDIKVIAQVAQTIVTVSSWLRRLGIFESK